jgi:predicted TIM-barrel fold metal-dependent hydrolase
MLIDTHQHVFWYGRDDAGLVADMDEHGIDLAWLLSWDMAPFEDAPEYHRVLNPLHRRGDGTHAGIPLSDLLRAREHYPQRFVVGYCPHPGLSHAAALFEAAYRMHGVRVCGEWKFRMLLDDPRCLELFRKAGELGCPVVLHLDVPYLADGRGGWSYQPLWFGGTVANLARALEACPGTTFIGHAPGFWREISGDADDDPKQYPDGPVAPGGRLHGLFEQYANLHADLSAGSGLGALRRDAAHARGFLTRFADRLLFGRDYYGGELMVFLRGLHLADDVMAKLCSANAGRLLGGGG